MTINREMFAEIHKLLIEFPKLHHQASWEALPHQNGTCGTTRCVAGWATWLGARDHKLLTLKRQSLTESVRFELSRRLGITPESTDGGWFYEGYSTSDFPVIGGKLLGLTDDQAHSLFHDMHAARVVERVKSFAETGEDLSKADYDSFDEDEDED